MGKPRQVKRAALLLCVLLQGCAGGGLNFEERYRSSSGMKQLPQPLVVLPIRYCENRPGEIRANPAARKLALAVWPAALAKALRLPGNLRTETVPADDPLCQILYARPSFLPNVNGDYRPFRLDNLEQQKMGDLLSKYMDKSAVVVAGWWLPVSPLPSGEVRDPADPVDSGERKFVENGLVDFSFAILARDHVVWMTGNFHCGAGTRRRCPAPPNLPVEGDYSNADKAAVYGLGRDFPWPLLGLKPDGRGDPDWAPSSAQVVAGSYLPPPPPPPPPPEPPKPVEPIVPPPAPVVEAPPAPAPVTKKEFKVGDKVEVEAGKKILKCAIVLVKQKRYRVRCDKRQFWTVEGKLRH